MTSGLTAFFRRLQSRPRHERRILGLAVYIAAAALVTVFWLSSLEQSLRLTPAIEESATIAESALGGQETQEAPELDKKTASAPEQITPLEALKQAAAAAMAGFRELTSEIKRLGKESVDLQIPLPAEAPLQETEPKPAEPSKTKSSSQETGASPAKILSGQMQAKTYYAYATAGLIRPPAEPSSTHTYPKNTFSAFIRENILRLSAETPRKNAEQNAELTRKLNFEMTSSEETPATASRIKNILYYNLGEMRQAAVDFYRYLTE